jgi:hypothetical protein
MVAIASASVQAGEMERKRKQTLERTRANHVRLVVIVAIVFLNLCVVLAFSATPDAAAVCSP